MLKRTVHLLIACQFASAPCLANASPMDGQSQPTPNAKPRSSHRSGGYYESLEQLEQAAEGTGSYYESITYLPKPVKLPPAPVPQYSSAIAPKLNSKQQQQQPSELQRHLPPEIQNAVGKSLRPELPAPRTSELKNRMPAELPMQVQGNLRQELRVERRAESGSVKANEVVTSGTQKSLESNQRTPLGQLLVQLRTANETTQRQAQLAAQASTALEAQNKSDRNARRAEHKAQLRAQRNARLADREAQIAAQRNAQIASRQAAMQAPSPQPAAVQPTAPPPVQKAPSTPESSPATVALSGSVATDAWKKGSKVSILTPKHQSEKAPKPGKEPKSGAVLTSVKLSKDAQAHLEADLSISLDYGEAIVFARQATTVRMGSSLTTIQPGSIALLSNRDDCQKIHNVYDKKLDSVKVIVGDRMFPVTVGSEIAVALNFDLLTAAVTGDKIKRRELTTYELASGVTVLACDFSPVALFRSSKVLSEMAAANDDRDKEVFNKVLKMAACLEIATSAHGGYLPVSKQ